MFSKAMALRGIQSTFGAITSPGELFKVIMTDIKGWLLAGAAVYAAVQFMLGAMEFMSKDPQKHSSGKDHMGRSCIGLVGMFAATALMTYLQNQSSGWTGGGQAIQNQLMILASMK